MADSMGGVTTTSSSSLVNRMIRAARLDSNLYEEVEADRDATSQAAIVVGIVAVCAAIGGALAIALLGAGGNLIGAVLRGLIEAFVGWVVWAYLTYFIGTRVFGGTATPGELLRTVGFAQSPGVLLLFAFIPVIGWLMAPVAAIWAIVAGVVAVRQALDFDTGKAIITTLIAFIPYLIVVGILTAIFG
jgi:hypothetical protein